jgi:hypothetical protein
MWDPDGTVLGVDDQPYRSEDMHEAPFDQLGSADVRRLVDNLELRELTARWCRGVDRADEELIRACYHSDGTDDHGDWRGTGSQFATYIVDLIRKRGQYHHCLGSQLFEIDGDVALGESYFVFHCLPPEGSPMYSWGRYVDRFERRNGEWRISSRTVVTDWMGTIVATNEIRAENRGFVTSTLDASDPVYRIKNGPIR